MYCYFPADTVLLRGPRLEFSGGVTGNLSCVVRQPKHSI